MTTSLSRCREIDRSGLSFLSLGCICIETQLFGTSGSFSTRFLGLPSSFTGSITSRLRSTALLLRLNDSLLRLLLRLLRR